MTFSFLRIRFEFATRLALVMCLGTLFTALISSCTTLHGGGKYFEVTIETDPSDAEVYIIDELTWAKSNGGHDRYKRSRKSGQFDGEWFDIFRKNTASVKINTGIQNIVLRKGDRFEYFVVNPNAHELSATGNKITLHLGDRAIHVQAGAIQAAPSSQSQRNLK